MTLPEMTAQGELPPGIHQTTLTQVLERFGQGSLKRQVVTRRMCHVRALALSTGHLQRFIIFGSYITDKPEPGDVDIILVMSDDFQIELCAPEVAILFNHLEAEVRFGASVFWIRPGLLLLKSMQDFLEHWQIRRDGTRRGIVEVLHD